MAQSKSFFSLRRGSTKTLTFCVYNGKQVTKDRVNGMKNPCSSMQMRQRAIMATTIHAYSSLREICDHSFEGVTYGQKSMNYFVAENARMIRAAAPKVNLSTYKGITVSNTYIISKGSLKPVIPSVASSGDNKYFFMNIDDNMVTTFGSLMAVFGATAVGDMVTFVNLVDNPGSSASINWLRLKLTEKNKSVVIYNNDHPVDVLYKIAEGTDYETNIDNFSTSDFPIFIKWGSGKLMLTIASGSRISAPVSQSLGIIVSHKSNTGWLRSSSTMVNLFDTYNYAEALATYHESGEKILNGGNV